MDFGIRWGGPPVGGLFFFGGLLLSGVGAEAQVVPGGPGRVQVYSGPTTGEAARFEVPQVRLPSAAVAGRINRELRRLLTANVSEADSTAALTQQLQQASRACCYDENLRRWEATGHGFTGCGY